MRYRYFTYFYISKQKPIVTFKPTCFYLLLFSFFVNAQNNTAITEQNNLENETTATETFLEPLNDKTTMGQKYFVNGLMELAGYTVDEIQVYQNLPNNAKIFRVIYNEESQSGFIFIRWDKKKQENYVANKMIDPEVYYNLKAAKEIMRQQTDKKAFNVDDIALQAPDQEAITQEEFEGLREEYNLQQEEKKLKQLERDSKRNKKKKN